MTERWRGRRRHLCAPPLTRTRTTPPCSVRQRADPCSGTSPWDPVQGRRRAAAVAYSCAMLGWEGGGRTSAFAIAAAGGASRAVLPPSKCGRPGPAAADCWRTVGYPHWPGPLCNFRSGVRLSRSNQQNLPAYWNESIDHNITSLSLGSCNLTIFKIGKLRLVILINLLFGVIEHGDIVLFKYV